MTCSVCAPGFVFRIGKAAPVEGTDEDGADLGGQQLLYQPVALGTIADVRPRPYSTSLCADVYLI